MSASATANKLLFPFLALDLCCGADGAGTDQSSSAPPSEAVGGCDSPLSLPLPAGVLSLEGDISTTFEESDRMRSVFTISLF